MCMIIICIGLFMFEIVRNVNEGKFGAKRLSIKLFFFCCWLKRTISKLEKLSSNRFASVSVWREPASAGVRRTSSHGTDFGRANAKSKKKKKPKIMAFKTHGRKVKWKVFRNDLRGTRRRSVRDVE